jgi:hypothetical protein
MFIKVRKLDEQELQFARDIQLAKALMIKADCLSALDRIEESLNIYEKAEAIHNNVYIENLNTSNSLKNLLFEATKTACKKPSKQNEFWFLGKQPVLECIQRQLLEGLFPLRDPMQASLSGVWCVCGVYSDYSYLCSNDLQTLQAYRSCNVDHGCQCSHLNPPSRFPNTSRARLDTYIRHFLLFTLCNLFNH